MNGWMVAAVSPRLPASCVQTLTYLVERTLSIRNLVVVVLLRSFPFRLAACGGGSHPDQCLSVTIRGNAVHIARHNFEQKERSKS